MAKTGQKAHFKMNEGRTGAVLLPTKFKTANGVNAQGQRYADLVDVYAAKAEKVDDTNDVDVASTVAKDKPDEIGYATRKNATDSPHPLFNSDHLNLNDDQVRQLKNELDMAQDNGNVLHEMAFSIRGDWLAENNLYNPKTHEIDQVKLKQAEQSIVGDLFEKGFALPLGESKNDVVWFGVIHQDTDHLNMHLWFAKKSVETRPEMLHQNPDGTVEPTGVINFAAKHQAEVKFSNRLLTTAHQDQKNSLLKSVDQRRQTMKLNALSILDQQPKYYADLQKIYEVLPQDLRGRWRVGNTDRLVTDDGSRMAPANRQMNQLIDKLLTDDLKQEYTSFEAELSEVDQQMTAVHGQQNKGQTSWSESRDNRLRKELANGIYRQFNEQFSPESPTNPKANGFQREQQGQFETIKQTDKNATSDKPHKNEVKQQKAKPTSTGVSHIQKNLQKLASQVMKTNREDLRRTKAFLRDQEQTQETLNGDQEANENYVPNADIHHRGRSF